MIHLRVVAPRDLAASAVACLTRSEAVSTVVHLPGAATKPVGDLILCDVAREQASVLVSELTALGLAEVGSITIEEAPTVLSAAADRAELAAPDMARVHADRGDAGRDRWSGPSLAGGVARMLVQRRVFLRRARQAAQARSLQS